MNEISQQPPPSRPEPWSRRFLQVFYAPSQLFSSLKNGPEAWWAPLLLVTAISAAISLMIVGPKIDWGSALEEAILSSGKVPGGQASEIADKMSGAYKFFGTVMGLAGPAIVYVLFSLYLWIIVNLCKRPISIAKCFAIYAWTDLINLPKSIMFAVLGLGIGQITSFKQLAGMSIGSPLCYIGDLDSVSFAAFGLLSKIDLFQLVHLAYIGFAVSALTGMKRPVALLLSFLPWIISFLFALGSFLLHSSR
jgi:hypothetical protein